MIHKSQRATSPFETGINLKPQKLKAGDTIAIVSLSSGILGEPFIKQQLDLGHRRLEAYGFNVKMMPNALRGLKYLSDHPEARADDLIMAFQDVEVKAIVCAIGGEDGFRLAPYLFENDALCEAVTRHPKIFLGFSDTTVHHLMLANCRLRSFYGQAFLADIAEHSTEMLPYSRQAFEDLFLQGKIDAIEPSSVWYEERHRYDDRQFGVDRVMHPDTKGYELLRGPVKFKGQIFAACIESLSDIFSGTRYAEEPKIFEHYDIMPPAEFWAGKILLLESSEEKVSPDNLEVMLRVLNEKGFFDRITGLLIGKPQDEAFYEEYKQVYLDIITREDLPIVYNINVGHATPRAIIPLWTLTDVDVEAQTITFLEDVLL